MGSAFGNSLRRQETETGGLGEKMGDLFGLSNGYNNGYNICRYTMVYTKYLFGCNVGITVIYYIKYIHMDIIVIYNRPIMDVIWV